MVSVSFVRVRGMDVKDKPHLYYNWGEDKARPNLDQPNFRILCAGHCALCVLLLIDDIITLLLDHRRRLLLLDLVGARPDLAVGDAETHDMVDKRLAPARARGYAKLLRKHLADEPEVRFRVKRGVEREDRPRPLEAVARKVELRLRRDRVDVELDVSMRTER